MESAQAQRTGDAKKSRYVSQRALITFFIVFLGLRRDMTRVTLEEFEQHKQRILNGTNSSTFNGGIRTSGSFSGASSVFVVQAADEAYAEKMKSMMETNQKWANCMNYTYQLKTLTNTGNMYSQKVEAIHDTLEAAQENDWIIYLDADVFFQADSCDALEKSMPLQSKIGSQPCELISMTSPHTINTGVLLLKSAYATKKLVRTWLEEQQKPDKLLSFGAADQLSLQEAVISDFLGALYEGKCGNMNDQAQRNMCFKEHIPEEYRSSRQMCLIPCHDKTPLQCQDCGGDCNRTAAIFKHDSKRERYREKHGYDSVA
mmetsp:Transcript_12565/g.26753  ORF Transcript_12565/g.26753 Transcript_12565/m.26753 type:complete len:316 (-) Transcript_12565:325-1272(-)|eukprot:CAMPEP_0183733858 /NCGR_PEP_ID=MMETSP0737-20130205/42210_1 /TAXON_ID=385413 /ORGANISM="Thalassiosira miniscula, Strain CCMP1093" /LENGTH=315 /DNA_ID=CAMNT_0025967209 /DNA_START=161 /DNA_END=1108 /DNA_ORIENTATION=+